MIDPHVALRLNRWFGVQCDAGSCAVQHVKVVCAVAHSQNIGLCDPKPRRDLLEGVDLGCFAKDRSGCLAGQLSLFDNQCVGAVFVKTQRRGYMAGEGRKTAGHKSCMTIVRLHRRNERLAPGHQSDAGVDDLLNDAFIEPRKQADPFIQRSLKIEFAVHRAGGDPRNMRANACFGGKFINTFLLNHCAVHIGQQ